MARGLVNIDVNGLRGVHVRTLRGDLRVARGWWVHEVPNGRINFDYGAYRLWRHKSAECEEVATIRVVRARVIPMFNRGVLFTLYQRQIRQLATRTIRFA